MNFGQPNVEIGQKMANGQLLFLGLFECCLVMTTNKQYGKFTIKFYFHKVDKIVPGSSYKTLEVVGIQLYFYECLKIY